MNTLFALVTAAVSFAHVTRLLSLLMDLPFVPLRYILRHWDLSLKNSNFDVSTFLPGRRSLQPQHLVDPSLPGVFRLRHRSLLHHPVQTAQQRRHEPWLRLPRRHRQRPRLPVQYHRLGAALSSLDEYRHSPIAGWFKLRCAASRLLP